MPAMPPPAIGSPGGFDLLHNNSLSRLPLERRRTGAMPTLTSLHVPPYDALRWFVQDSLARTIGSPRRRRLTPARGGRRARRPPSRCSITASIPTPGLSGGGRRHRRVVRAHRGDQGTHFAIAAARRAGLALTLFGPIEEPDYWDAQVAPLLGGAIRYGGHLSGAAFAAEIGRASVFLFTPCWDEPFGLVAVEAMACGLPIAGFDSGAGR